MKVKTTLCGMKMMFDRIFYLTLYTCETGIRKLKNDACGLVYRIHQHYMKVR